jgi:O-acetyl-ADP-ribose deacetylase (regulator of RNase III)
MENKHIIEIKGNILDSRMQSRVNTINCVGVMGKGIALSFKQKYPEMFNDYKKRCQLNQVKLGHPYIYSENNSRYIINFPTKKHWKDDSKLEWIEAGLKQLVINIKKWKITSLAIPPLGCTNGGLKWKDVRPLIYFYLSPIGIPIEIYVS